MTNRLDQIFLLAGTAELMMHGSCLIKHPPAYAHAVDYKYKDTPLASITQLGDCLNMGVCVCTHVRLHVSDHSSAFGLRVQVKDAGNNAKVGLTAAQRANVLLLLGLSNGFTTGSWMPQGSVDQSRSKSQTKLSTSFSSTHSQPTLILAYISPHVNTRN